MDEYDVDSALQAALDRLTLLHQSAAALEDTLDAVERLRRVCRVLVPALAAWCAADLMDDNGIVERVCVTHRNADTDVAGLTGVLPPVLEAASDPWSQVLHGAAPILLAVSQLPTPQEAPSALHVANLQLVERLGGDSMIVTPLRARGRVLGALTLVRQAERLPLDEGDLVLVRDLSHRMALAVDNALLYAESQTIAENLQRSLLPDPPTINDLRVAARYTPAVANSRVRSDWYDCFLLPQGEIALIIGDVKGHDLEAAVAMSQLRNMLRGIACDRLEAPGDILHRLDMAMDALHDRRSATCVYALLKGPRGGPYHLEWSNAGHHPPLLITADGETTYLRDSHGMQLGLEPYLGRTSANTPLPAGSTLLLYTKGLIEDRTESLNHGMTKLRHSAAALAHEDLETMSDELLTGIAGGKTNDTALLAVRLPAATEH